MAAVRAAMYVGRVMKNISHRSHPALGGVRVCCATLALVLGAQLSAQQPGSPASPSPSTPSTTREDSRYNEKRDNRYNTDPRTNSGAGLAGATGTTTARGEISRADRRFILRAAKNDKAEIALGQLAVQRSADSRVRDFAQRMVTDHQKTSNELMEIAARKGVNLMEEEELHADHTKKFADKTGAGFDEDYMEHMVDDHDEAVELFERAAKKSDDPEIAAFAAKHLPALQEHQRMAKDILKAVDR
jgi:putative membrane protein